MNMASPRSQAVETIERFLVRAGKEAAFTPETSLFAEGLGLDSLETAELSSMLEDDLGSDPFSTGIMAQSVGEILDFYPAEEQLPA
jgi:acyl carrier protein